MVQRVTRRAALGGLGLAALAFGGAARAQYPYPPQGGRYGGPQPYGDPRDGESERRRDEDHRREDERRAQEDQRFRGPPGGDVRREQQYNQGLLALQQRRNQGVLSLQQQFNAGRITRGQLSQGTAALDQQLQAQVGRR